MENGGVFHLISQNGIKMQTQAGNINIHSGKNLIFRDSGGADMYIGNDLYGIAVAKDGSLNIRGKTITFAAPQINIYESAAA